MSVTWKMILGYTVLLALFLLLLVGCGTRRVENDKTVTSEREKVEESSKGRVVKSEETSVSSSDKQDSKDVSENLSKRVEELYDENGKLKSRITTLEKSSVDKSSSREIKSLIHAKIRLDSTFNNKIYRNIVITEIKRVKVVDANKSILANIGIWGILGITVIVVGAIWLWFYIKRKSKWLEKEQSPKEV